MSWEGLESAILCYRPSSSSKVCPLPSVWNPSFANAVKEHLVRGVIMDRCSWKILKFLPISNIDILNCSPYFFSGWWEWKSDTLATGMSERGVWRWHLHGEPLWSTLLWKVLPHLHAQAITDFVNIHPYCPDWIRKSIGWKAFFFTRTLFICILEPKISILCWLLIKY